MTFLSCLVTLESSWEGSCSLFSFKSVNTATGISSPEEVGPGTKLLDSHCLWGLWTAHRTSFQVGLWEHSLIPPTASAFSSLCCLRPLAKSFIHVRTPGLEIWHHVKASISFLVKIFLQIFEFSACSGCAWWVRQWSMAPCHHHSAPWGTSGHH